MEVSSDHKTITMTLTLVMTDPMTPKEVDDMRDNLRTLLGLDYNSAGFSPDDYEGYCKRWRLT